MVDDDDIVRGANKLFKSVGSALKKAGGVAAQAGKTAGEKVVKTGRQVVGSRGTLAVSLDRERFAPGDEIRGKVTLAIDEPIEGTKLVVQLRATQRTVDYHRAGGVRTVGTSTALIFQFEKELGGARGYGSEELPFTLVVPRDAARAAAAPAGKVGAVARAVSSVVAPTTGPIEWRVQATLVISFGRDLAHGVDIIVD
jgi:hypothetical protein